jgi:hypothetical protein
MLEYLSLVCDILSDCVWYSVWLCVIFYLIVCDILSDCMWYSVWLCVIFCLIVCDILSDCVWYSVWLCVIFCLIVWDILSDCKWSIVNEWVVEWLNGKWTIFSLYHGVNNLHFHEMMMMMMTMPALYNTNTLSWIFIVLSLLK